jgi:hypothetical protein
MKAKSLLFLLGSLASVPLFGAGTLTPTESGVPPVQIRSHQVNVTINNGFAQTEVLQTFFNSQPRDLEAIYAFPVPKGASLSAVTIATGEKILQGEVLPKAEAERAYEEEKKSGNDAGLARRSSGSRPSAPTPRSSCVSSTTSRWRSMPASAATSIRSRTAAPTTSRAASGRPIRSWKGRSR